MVGCHKWSHHVLDHKNLTKAQKVLFELDSYAYLFLMDALSFELFYKVNHKGTAHELWESIKHTFGDSSTWDDGKFKKVPLLYDNESTVKFTNNPV